MIAHDPLLRSGRAELPHPAPTALRQRQASKPRFNVYCSDLSQFILSPVRTNPSVQIRLVRFLGSVTAPGVVLCEFPLLKVVAELCDRKRASTNPRFFPN